MKFVIGAHRNPSLAGKHISQVSNVIWATVNAPDCNEAAKIFILSHLDELYQLQSCQFYSVSDTLNIHLLYPVIDNIECDDQRFAF